MRTLNLISFFIFFLLCCNQSKAQNIFHYGPDTTNHYYPSDIIATQNGELVVMADVNNRGSWFHNYFFKRYVFRITTNGSPVWSLIHADTKGQGLILEQATGGFTTLNNIDGAYACGLIGQSIPYTDYSVNTYAGTGTLSTSNSYDEACENSLSNFKKRDDGGIMAIQTAIVSSINIPSVYEYSIKELAPNGQLSSLDFPIGITGGGFVEKHATGYWILQYDSLYRLDLAGNIVSQDTIINYPYLRAFTKVAQDSLLIVSSAEQTSAPDLTYLSKYDAFGKKDWTRIFDMETNHVLLHSSGNYLLTGTRNDQLSLLMVSPSGDSLWSRTQALSQPSAAVKTIEIAGNKIATLGRENSTFTMMSGRVIVVLDSIDWAPMMTPIRIIAPALVAQYYPNPSNGQVHFTVEGATNEGYQLTLTSLLGQAVFSESFAQTSFSIGVEHLPKGVYIVKITNAKGAVFEEKLVIGR
ncbi:MAG: T9SS type A sorting domain-containing protein [Aureispira sp.]